MEKSNWTFWPTHYKSVIFSPYNRMHYFDRAAITRHILQTLRLKQTVQGARNPWAQCQQNRFLLPTVRESITRPSPRFWQLGNCHVSRLLLGHPGLCLHPHVAFSLCAWLCVQISPFKDSSNVGLGWLLTENVTSWTGKGFIQYYCKRHQHCYISRRLNWMLLKEMAREFLGLSGS